MTYLSYALETRLSPDGHANSGGSEQNVRLSRRAARDRVAGLPLLLPLPVPAAASGDAANTTRVSSGNEREGWMGDASGDAKNRRGQGTPDSGECVLGALPQHYEARALRNSGIGKGGVGAETPLDELVDPRRNN